MTGTENELMDERYGLVMDRIKETMGEDAFGEPLLSFFHTCSSWLIFLSNILERSLAGKISDVSTEDLAAENHKLYEDILPANYAASFANPDFAVSEFKKADISNAGKLAQYLSFTYTELRGLIGYAFEGQKEIFTIFAELYAEIYTSFRLSALDETYPDPEGIRDIIYWFERDNCDVIIPENVSDKVDASNDFVRKIVCDADLDDERFLYLSGEYVTENEKGIARFLNTLSEEEIKSMADTFTEGYRIGFVKAAKPLDKKTSANIRYSLGFERIVRQAVKNFADMGLESVIYRARNLSLTGGTKGHMGFYGAIANRQYDYDHKDDEALYLDADLVTRKLEVLTGSFEEKKTLANGHAGPAVMEVFGEEPFTPVVKENAVHHTDKTQRLSVDYSAKASLVTNKYIIGEERSFTIIAYPIPEIGDDFEKIFADTVKLNTLPYEKYEKIQQYMIDALDKADSVTVKGKGDNVTDLNISLHTLSDPDHQTNFENCVADVNIPVGEVFTSPKLSGTNGVLHVTKVFLNGLLYKDLKITFADGMITDYSCANYDNDDDNKKFIKDNLLFKHDTLPIGEFAIGTNTTAYRMGRDYDIEGKLPILIGEKTGPHFAVGDTCYSHEEDVKVFNPDGKEIIARENEVSAKRDTNIKEAYFQCHTDITIPYDELDFIRANCKDGNVYIIRDGRFVLPGCEELNEPLERK
ncbi:MAG: aminopeptidase [Lachnospiraceae bacterium]|nr:aminopeptidase [Lachnospiraceae bacterium]